MKEDQLNLFVRNCELNHAKNISSGIKIPKSLIKELTSESVKRLLINKY